jgi:hypothetical protein
VEAVGKLDDHHANIVDHGQNHFANIFGLARFRRELKGGYLGDAFNQAGRLFAESFLNPRHRKLGIFNDIVKQGGRKRGGVHTHIREYMGDFEKVSQVRFAGATELVTMTLGGDFVGAADRPRIIGRAVIL